MASPATSLVAVCPDPPRTPSLLKAAARLSVNLGLPLLERPWRTGVEMLLVVTPRRLELRVVGGDITIAGGRPVYVDASKLDVTSPAGRRLKQPMAKAVGLKRLKDLETHRPIVIDATTGWGADSFLLASLGCEVLAVERHPVVHALWHDGLLRAISKWPSVYPRLSAVNADARAMFHRMARRNPDRSDAMSAKLGRFLVPDVIYLDPMFPTRKPGRGAEPKPLRVLRRLVGDDPDATGLFRAALQVARRRVIVKRPLRAASLDDMAPTASHKGKSLRYDIYVVK